MANPQHRNVTDEQLDRDWIPSGRRPQSTMARSFSQELMEIFRLENSVADLDQKVDERRHNVGKTSEELASIEARIKEMENRLRQTQKSRPELAGLISLPHRPPTREGQNTAAASQTKDEHSKNRSRPGTARAAQPAPGSGNMPPTPGGSEDGDRE